MADTQVKNETTLTTSAGDELIYIVGDPSGTPVDRKVTAKALRLVLNQGVVALTDAAPVVTDCSTGNIFTLTMSVSRTFSAPTNMKTGATYIWIIRQPGGGSCVATWNSAFLFPGGTDAVLSTGASAVDVITGVYDGVGLLCSSVLNFA